MPFNSTMKNSRITPVSNGTKRVLSLTSSLLEEQLELDQVRSYKLTLLLCQARHVDFSNCQENGNLTYLTVVADGIFVSMA